MRSNTFQFDETAIIIPGEGMIGDIFHYVEGKYALHQRAYRIHVSSDTLNLKFLFHIMVASFKQYILMKSVGATAISIRKPMIENFPIPIPCPNDPQKSLAIQKEIARILDKFTELTTELTARQKQYKYYRDQLLTFADGEAEWKTLGEVCKVLRGKRLTKKELSEKNIFPVFHGGLEPLGFYSKSNRPKDTVMIINVGASAGTVGFSPVEFWSSDGCFCLEHSEVLNNKFLYYFLIGEQPFLKSRVRVAGIPTLDNFVVEKLKIPIPPIKEQERIVSILDKFDTLTTSISEGLPKEIALRKKQYEHYRDLLLTFPKTHAI